MSPVITDEFRRLKAREVAIVGALVNTTLGILKLVVGTIGHSQALIADGIHSLSDLSTDLLVYFASHYGSQKADKEHPYGHRRIETAATLILSLVVILAGFGIAWDSLRHLFVPHSAHPGWGVLSIAVFSIFANEAIYHYTQQVAKRIDSALLSANAWHHRSDALSSIVVMLGVAGSMMGFYYLDSVAAVIVAIMVMRMGCRLGWSSVLELIDTAVDEDVLVHINQVINKVSGVVTIHQLRTRSMGGKVLVDVHIIVAPDLSVSEGHHISQHVHRDLLKEVKAVTDVTVHVDPENDELAAPSFHLPHRELLLPQLKAKWAGLPAADEIKDVTLHYLAGEITVQIKMPLSVLETTDDVTALQLTYQRALTELEPVAQVELVFV
jgi:cation diffusion facilitator family transporter